MLTIDEMKKKLKQYIDNKRYVHSINVANTAVSLAKLYKQDPGNFQIAGLLHDCAKCLDKNQQLYYIKKYNIELDELTINLPALNHGPIGAKIAKYEFDVNDKEVCDAIYYHTTGCENMSVLTKIIYIADFIEPSRKYKGVESLRQLAFSGDLDGAVIRALNNTIIYVVNNNNPLHPRTVYARNYLLKYSRYKNTIY